MNEASIFQEVARRDQERLRRYRDNLDFYSGHQWVSRPRSRERRLTLNYVKTVVDKVTSYLMSGLDFVVDPGGPGQEAQERARHSEELLYRVYQENNLEMLDFDTEVDTAVLGDGCYKVLWDPAEGRVRVSAPDVQGIFAWWLGDDIACVWRVASRYQLSREEVAQLYRVKSRGEKATLLEVWTAERFELWIDGALQEERANPYGFIPFAIFPNLREPKRFWGVSDIPAIEEVARELNRAMSALSMILELSGNPIAVLENIDRAEDIAVAPGAVWEIPEKAKAYLLDLLSGGGVRLHIDYVNQLYKVLHDLSEAPRTSFGDSSRDLSGVALEIELHPLLQKVRRKRLIRSAVYRKRNEMILRIAERFTGETFAPYRSRIVWGPVLPQDRTRLVRDEQALVSAGIHSRRRAMDNLGIESPEREWASWLEEAAALRELGQGSALDPSRFT